MGRSLSRIGPAPPRPRGFGRIAIRTGPGRRARPGHRLGRLVLAVAVLAGFPEASSLAQPSPPALSAPGPAAPSPLPPGPDRAPRPAPARLTLPDPVLTCRTLSELLLWDDKETDGEVLRRTVAEQTCRNLPGGTAVSVAETATIRGTAYQCLHVEGETECLWAGAVAR
jgi:hypothetical protein